MQSLSSMMIDRHFQATLAQDNAKYSGLGLGYVPFEAGAFESPTMAQVATPPGFRAPPGLDFSPAVACSPPIPWRLLDAAGDSKKEKGADLDETASANGSTMYWKSEDPDELDSPGSFSTAHNSWKSEGEDMDSLTPIYTSEKSEDLTEGKYVDLPSAPLEANTSEAPLSEDECHTLMIKHLPCRCSQKEVLDGIASVGFGERYEFFYLPIRRGHTQNFGYAFVGFKDAESCAAFAEAMTGYHFPGRSSGKACVLAPARIQGFQDNIHHFEKTRGLRRNNGPILSLSV
jgi:hypothetical protein